MIDYLLEITFGSDPLLEERVQGALFLTPSTGSTSVDANDRTTISAYFDSAEARASAAESLRGLPLSMTPLDRDRLDWLERYQQSLEPLFIGRFVVAPSPEMIPSGGDLIAIVVPQEQAFGTGSHETTSLCLEMLETLPMDGRTGLDIGTGSAILAVAMVRLGARRVVAFDNDVDAYGAMRDNRMRNRVAESTLPMFIGSVEALRGGRFEVITMNMLPEVILALLEQVRTRMAGGAALILSGILLTQRDRVVEGCRQTGLRLEQETAKGEWWCGLFR
jgi:ribosomal protein L11 methyltransferase